MTIQNNYLERNFTNVLISALAMLPEIPTLEQVERKAEELAAVLSYTGDLRNVVSDAMISVVTRMGSGVSLVDVDANHDDQWIRKRGDINWIYSKAYEEFLRQDGWPPPDGSIPQ